MSTSQHAVRRSSVARQNGSLRLLHRNSAPAERLADTMDLVRFTLSVGQEFYNRQNEIVRLVERVKDFIARGWLARQRHVPSLQKTGVLLCGELHFQCRIRGFSSSRLPVQNLTSSRLP